MARNARACYTDFDLQLRSQPPASQQQPHGAERFRVEANRAICGTASGGGPEIELRTFNGSVFLRKLP